MTKTYSNELQQALINTSVIDGKTKAYQATIDLAAQASGDTIVIAKARQGEKFVAGIITTDTSLSTATVKIGNKDDDDKYKAAAVFTATNTPTLFGNAAAMAALAADEEIFITVGTAALPGSGTLKVTMLFAVNN
jgi:hypothetical protein